MKRYKYALLIFIAIIMYGCCFSLSWADETIIPPEKFFGFQPGADRHLIDYEELISYLVNLDKASSNFRVVVNSLLILRIKSKEVRVLFRLIFHL